MKSLMQCNALALQPTSNYQISRGKTSDRQNPNLTPNKMNYKRYRNSLKCKLVEDKVSFIKKKYYWEYLLSVINLDLEIETTNILSINESHTKTEMCSFSRLLTGEYSDFCFCFVLI